MLQNFIGNKMHNRVILQIPKIVAFQGSLTHQTPTSKNMYLVKIISVLLFIYCDKVNTHFNVLFFREVFFKHHESISLISSFMRKSGHLKKGTVILFQLKNEIIEIIFIYFWLIKPTKILYFNTFYFISETKLHIPSLKLTLKNYDFIM